MTVREFISYVDKRTTGSIPPIEMVVSASGSGGDGSEGSPYSWDEMLINLRQNATVVLRAGTYTPTGIIAINGESGRPITFKPYPNEIVKINFSDQFRISGNYITFNGSGGIIEIYHSAWGTTRFSSLGDDNYNLSMNGLKCTIINCFIHDTGGIGNWSGALESLYYGNLVWNIGQGGTGTPMYTQNGATGTKNIRSNMIARTFWSNYIIHQYGTSSTKLERYNYQDNISVGGIWLFGSGGSPVDDVVVRGNTIINAVIQLGQLGIPEEVEHKGWDFLENTLLNTSITVKKGKEYQIKDNNFYHTVTSILVILFDLDGIEVDRNNYNYYGTIPSSKFQFPQGKTYSSFAAWQAGTGFDLNSSYATSPSDFIEVKGNDYDDDRGTVVIANFSEASSVSVDLSTLPLTVGRDYKLLNAQNPEESVDFTWAEENITVTMEGWTVSIPLGTESDSMPTVASMFPLFGAFYLIRDI